jgi:hypothetical protein
VRCPFELPDVPVELLKDYEGTTLQISISLCPISLSFLSQVWHLPDPFMNLTSRESASWKTHPSYDNDIHITHFVLSGNTLV